MPIYEYVCTNCNKSFEILVRSTSQKIVCPQCQQDKVERKFSAFGMKSGQKFVSSSGSGCSGCGSSSCHSCKK